MRYTGVARSGAMAVLAGVMRAPHAGGAISLVIATVMTCWATHRITEGGNTTIR